MNTQPLHVLVTTPIRASVATRVAFATAARQRAQAKGLTAAQWSIERLKQPTTLAADLLMAFDEGGEVVLTHAQPAKPAGDRARPEPK